MRTQDLIGAQLDWAVSLITNPEWSIRHRTNEVTMSDKYYDRLFNPSEDWAQGGALIEREITKIFRNVGGTWSAMILKYVPIPPEDRGTSLALTYRAQWNGAGPTPLIAAMRCFCASRLGDEINIPEFLK